MAAEDPATVVPGAAERYRRLCAAFDELHPLDAAARTAALAELRARAPDLVDEVSAMLAASAGPGLNAVRPLPPVTLPDDLGDERGYRVLRELGRGGMGRVLLAERADGRFTRQVAIKVLDRSPHDADWRRRFVAEREILARLKHPHIVQLLDAGETVSGVPYLVMEFVSGEPLDRFLRAHRPGLEARLKLFEQVASAVGYAHQMLVAHRDIKPGNVLVDDGGYPHLLDFGIARLLSEPSATATAGQALTPRYAAPEQVAGQPSSAALDIYQLGLLLYELLAGEPPFADLDGPALLHAVLETDPPPPSRVARELAPSDARRIDADLDAICLRALRKEPVQRYASVDALLADIERWRNGEPVRASEGGFAYRSRKFVRRHWRALAVAAGMVGVSAAFVWQLNRELARTESERAVAEQATELIVDVIGRADPSRAKGKELTLREALDQSVERLRETDKVPDRVRARLLAAVGETYLELSQNAQAVALLSEAADAYMRVGDQDGQEKMLHAHAVALQNLGNYAEAQAAMEALIAMRSARAHGNDALEAELHGNLGNLHQYQHRPEAALDEYGKALAILRTMPEPDQGQLAHALRNLGDIRTAQGDAEGGLAPLQEAHTLIQQMYGADDPETIRMYRALGRNAQRRERYDEALGYFEEGWTRAQRVFVAPHQVRVLLAHPLALARFHRGEFATAAALMKQAAAEAVQLFPADHPSLSTIAVDLSFILLHAGEYAEARRQAQSGRSMRVAHVEIDAHIAEPELVLAVLDCLQQPGADARAQVQRALDRALSDTALAVALRQDYQRAAELCKP